MLFHNFEPFFIPETGDVSREKLKAEFPEFYEGRAIKLTAVPERYREVTKVSGAGQVRRKAAQFKKGPPTVGHKAIFHVVIDKKPIALQYSKTMPEAGAFGKRFPGGLDKIQIGERFVVQPGDEELLFGLHFGVDYIANNLSPKKGEALYEWNRPAAKADLTVRNWKEENKFKKLIYEDISMDKVKLVCKGLGIDEGETDTATKVRLCDKVIAMSKANNTEFMNLFNELVASDDQPETATNVSELVDTLIEEGKIKEVEGGYVSKSKLKIGEWNKTPFFATKLTGDEARLELIKFLKTNSKKREELSA